MAVYPMNAPIASLRFAVMLGGFALTVSTVPAADPTPAAVAPTDPVPDQSNPNFPYIGKQNPQGNAVRLAKASGHISNYDESRIPPYTLPDPLVLQSGKSVKDADTWFK